jgi:beta-N-acetylhexosaminidase
MVITYAKDDNRDFIQNSLMGGVYFVSKPSMEEFINSTSYYQDGALIPLYIAADMEGCWNPFLKFYKSPLLPDVQGEEEAYELGLEHGSLLKEAGFSINFAPVADLNDTIWRCRSFTGSPEEISSKAIAYSKGLEEQGIIATVKHYPGKTLIVDDTHKSITHATITEDDMLPFMDAIRSNISAVMVSHLIVDGEVSSGGMPAGASQVLVGGIRQGYDGLIITDEIGMLGLKDFYDDPDQMYIDIFRAGNDIILDFDINPMNLTRMIDVVEQAVLQGQIPEERIDSSVKRILSSKGVRFV